MFVLHRAKPADGQSFARLGQFGMARFFIFAGCQTLRSGLMRGGDRLVLLDDRFQKREILFHACRQCSGEPLASDSLRVAQSAVLKLGGR